MKKALPMFVMNVKGRSMFPTFSPRDKVLVNKLSYLVASPSVDDIVVVKHPSVEGKLITKRVIAGPLSRVKVDGDMIEVNNVPKENYIPAGAKQHKKYTVSVPKDSYFVMGDNPYCSTDSRHFGAVNKSNIIGKVIQHLPTS